jgi:hypothetical protein
VFKQVHRLLLFLALLWALAPPSTQAQVIDCPSGFASTGNCGVGIIAGGQAFELNGSPSGSSPALVGSQVLLVPPDANHAAMSLTYQTQLNIQAFTASFTFVPNGWATSFIINNSSNNPYFNGSLFSAGAGCEADFFQGYSQTNPPNKVFALDFDSYSPLINGNPFSYSSAQIYISPSGGYVQCPCQSSVEGCGTNNGDPSIAKISTSPVPLNSPAGYQNTTTGDTYSATITYDGSNFTLNLYDVTAGGSCPGSSCFTNTWTNVNIPSSVGGNTAWVGFGGSTGSNPVLNVPVSIKSFVYNVGTPTGPPPPPPPPPPGPPPPPPPPTPTATSTPTPKPPPTTYKHHWKKFKPA